MKAKVSGTYFMHEHEIKYDLKTILHNSKSLKIIFRVDLYQYHHNILRHEKIIRFISYN